MLEGGCHCGAVRYQAGDTPVRHSLCHCSDCRRSAGAPFVAWAVYPEGEFRITKGAPSAYASSEHAKRYFCAACGTGLYYTNPVYLPGVVDIQSATLDDPERIGPPTSQVQMAEALSWIGRVGAVPGHQRYPG